jgi:hypothetical protein
MEISQYENKRGIWRKRKPNPNHVQIIQNTFLCSPSDSNISGYLREKFKVVHPNSPTVLNVVPTRITAV